jgi:hypothetical protein
MMTGREEPRFVLHEQKVKYRHLDLRREHDGVQVNWAVPKGLPEINGEMLCCCG